MITDSHRSAGSAGFLICLPAQSWVLKIFFLIIFAFSCLKFSTSTVIVCLPAISFTFSIFGDEFLNPFNLYTSWLSWSRNPIIHVGASAHEETHLYKNNWKSYAKRYASAKVPRALSYPKPNIILSPFNAQKGFRKAMVWACWHMLIGCWCVGFAVVFQC